MTVEVETDVLGLAQTLRLRLANLITLAQSGRGSDVHEAALHLQEAIRGFGVLQDLLETARPGAKADLAEVLATRVREELEASQVLVRRLGRLIQQGQEIRLAHWTPPPAGAYSPAGACAADPIGPRLVRHLA